MDTERNHRLVQKYIGQMPSLSTTVTKVLEVCNNPTASPNDLNRVISLDPILTGQVLKLINSAYYSLPNKITSLTRAIIMLGINTVKNLVLATSVIGGVGSKKHFKTLSMDAFWEHSLAVGVLAKELSIRKGLPAIEREEFFVAGLLHDLGKIPFNNRFADTYAQVLLGALQASQPLFDQEQSSFGLTHAEVGGMIADKWNLSHTMRAGLSHHHTPELADPSAQTLVSLVALANFYVNRFAIGTSGDPRPDEDLRDRLLAMTGFKNEEILALRSELLDEIDKAKVFLQVSSNR
ncbi:MAG: HDOD domain-containing protein [Desulfosarcinaceae bacterium]|nr:HDOD domain-containing protein [Desulfosarcinaceae bacterium]